MDQQVADPAVQLHRVAPEMGEGAALVMHRVGQHPILDAVEIAAERHHPALAVAGDLFQNGFHQIGGAWHRIAVLDGLTHGFDRIQGVSSGADHDLAGERKSPVADLLRLAVQRVDRIGQNTGQGISRDAEVLVVTGREQRRLGGRSEIRSGGEPVLAALVDQIEMQPDPAAGLRTEGRGQHRVQGFGPTLTVEPEAPKKSRQVVRPGRRERGVHTTP
jgi:hypothetical protein